MALLILFMVALFILPFQMDAEKNGSNNILQRAGKELLETQWVSSIFKSLNFAFDKVTSFVAGLVAVIIFLVVTYFLVRLISAFINWVF